MAIVLALVAAISWTFGDYASALAARRFTSIAVITWSQTVGMVLLLPVALAFGGSPAPADIALGLAAGILNFGGWALMAEGMRGGRIGVVIPTSSVVGALIPVAIGVALGDALNGVAVAGIVAAIAGSALAASEEHFHFDVRALVFGGTSGIAFAIMFVVLSQTNDDAGIWPVFIMRTTVPVVFLTAYLRKVDVRPTRDLVTISTLVVLGGTIALPAYTLAAREGPLSVVTTIATTSPAGTVLVAHFLGHERTNKLQMIGVILAVFGIILLTLR